MPRRQGPDLFPLPSAAYSRVRNKFLKTANSGYSSDLFLLSFALILEGIPKIFTPRTGVTLMGF